MSLIIDCHSKWNVTQKGLFITVMSETSFYYRDRDQDFLKPSLDIETGIETFENLVLILRLVSRLLELQS